MSRLVEKREESEMHEDRDGDASVSREAPPTRNFARLPSLGVLLVIGGAVLSLTGFVNGWEASIKGRDTAATAWGIVTIAGLATVALGAGVLVWGAVAMARRRGPLPAVLAGTGALGSVILLAYVTLAGGNVGVAVATGSAIVVVVVVVGIVLLHWSGERSARGRSGRC